MIAKTAIVSKGAQIAEDAKIGDFCVIGDGVVIDSGSEIYNHVTLVGNTKIGKRNRIFPYCAIGFEPQDLKYQGEEVELIIGDDNTIREHCMFNPGTKGGGSRTIIGNKNLFMTFSHVAHDCIIGDNNIFANNATLGGHVVVGDHVNFGGLSAAHQFVKVGNGAMIAAGSILAQDAPPFCMLEGPRAKIRGLNRHRMRLLFTRQEIDKISSLYKKIFDSSDLVANRARQELELLDPSETILRGICEFIIDSKRGIPLKRENE